jgi:hypothetical protein
MITDFNINPYYDDFDEAKKFLKILFRPGYAVQARELTQIQSILQNQVSRFGNNIFKNGSLITGGEQTYSNFVKYLKLKTTDANGNFIVANNFNGKIITNDLGNSSNAGIAKVLAVDETDTANGPTLIIQYTVPFSTNSFTFSTSSNVYTLETSTNTAITAASTQTGNSSSFSINDGIYYVDGYFVKVDAQTISLDTYSSSPSYRIGLTLTDEIVTEVDDVSLLDPALEASNYQAPGAARYKITATLDKRSLTSTDDSKFIEIARVENGVLTKSVVYTSYADLEKTLARRTYDQSGNFTVKPFTINLNEHIPDAGQTANTELFTATLSAGKAYVNGFEFETISPTNIAVDRARTKQNVSNYDISTTLGNYFVAANVSGTFNISTFQIVDLHNVIASSIDKTSNSTYQGTRIGTARVAQIDYVAASNTQLSNTYTYDVYLTDTRFTANNIQNVKSIVVATTGTPTTFTANADVSTTNKDASGNTFLSDTNYNKLVFKVPQSFVAYGMADQSYRGKKVFTAQSPVSNVVTINTGSASNYFVGNGSLADTDRLNHFMVVTRTAAAGFAANSVIPLVSATGRTVTVTGSTQAAINLGNNQFTSIDVIATVDYSASTPRTKTLNLANTTNVAVSGGTTIGNTTIYSANGQVAISTPNKVPGNTDVLYVSDVYKLDGKFEENYGYFTITKADGTTRKSSFKVIDSQNTAVAVSVSDLTNTSKDITYRYTLDDGQRDTYYDHGGIVLNHGATPPSGQILVLFNYFTHSGSGYISVDSYTDTNLGANSSIRYAKIPNYTSPTDGQVYALRDCIDFRPIRANAANTTPDFTLSGISLPKEDQYVQSDYSYYVPRADRLVLTPERQFRIIEGTPDLYPQTPSEPSNSMTLYTLGVPPYTFFPSDVTVRYFENKRYTMNDIGKLEKRINNLEYYTTLNTLEKQASDMSILDSAGLERFKNGILVDAFKGHSVGDVQNPDYVCSIDTNINELRPSFISNSIDFSIDYANTVYGSIYANNIVSMKFSEVSLVSQNVYSSSVAINPFMFSNFTGTVQLDPPGDSWIDTNQRPDVLVNLEGNNDAWAAIGQALNDSRAPGWGTVWNDWQTISQGTPFVTDQSSFTQNRTEGYLTYQDTITRTTTQVNSVQTRTTQPFNTLVPESVIKSIGNRQVDLSVVPYMRAEKVYYSAKNMMPNMRSYHFFDGTNVDNFIEKPSFLSIYDKNGKFKVNLSDSETITSTSGGTAKVLKVVDNSWSSPATKLYIVDVQGTFAANDTITGSISGVTAKIDVPVIISGNVASANSSNVTLYNGMTYDNIYNDFANTMTSLVAADTFFKTKTFNYGENITAANYNSLTGFNTIKIVSGKGLGQTRIITAYNGTTKTATISSSWSVIPDSTSVYSIGYASVDDVGGEVGIFHLPSYNATSYDNGYKFRTGERKFRICDDSSDNENNIRSFADANYYAQGYLNTVEDVSVSVRVPVIQSKTISDTRNQTSYAVTDSLVGTTIISDNTPAPVPGMPAPTPDNDNYLILCYAGAPVAYTAVWDVSQRDGGQPMGAFGGLIAWRVVYIGSKYTGIASSEYNPTIANDASTGPYYRRAATPGSENGLVVGSLILTSTGVSPSSWSSYWKTQNVAWQGGFSYDGHFYSGNNPNIGAFYNWYPVSWDIGPTPWILGLPSGSDPLTSGAPASYTSIIPYADTGSSSYGYGAPSD